MFLPLAFENLHVVLRTLFDKMLPLCSEMTAIASGIAGLGALLYISYRVWQSLARAEPIDVFPLLRPFALGLCILFFEPLVLGTINGILSPVVQGTHKLLVGQTFDMGKYQKDKQELMKATAEANFDQLATAQTGEETTAMLEEMNLEPADLMALQQMYEESSSWSLKGMITKAFHWLLELLFDCASLIIDTIRTFFLIVLAILGPLAFAVAVYDGFHASACTVAVEIHQRILMAAYFRFVRRYSGPFTGTFDTERYGDAGHRSFLYVQRRKRRIAGLSAHRNLRLFHHSEYRRMDRPCVGYRQL